VELRLVWRSALKKEKNKKRYKERKRKEKIGKTS